MRAGFAYGEPMENETKRRDDARLAVATKCTFCVERIDEGLAQGLRPGVDPEATPACVNACITQTLTFGDLDDPAEQRVEASRREPAFPDARGARHRARLLLPLGREGG